MGTLTIIKFAYIIVTWFYLLMQTVINNITRHITLHSEDSFSYWLNTQPSDGKVFVFVLNFVVTHFINTSRQSKVRNFNDQVAVQPASWGVLTKHVHRKMVKMPTYETWVYNLSLFFANYTSSSICIFDDSDFIGKKTISSEMWLSYIVRRWYLNLICTKFCRKCRQIKL